MFGLGMSSRDIASHVADLYGLSISHTTISSVTDKLIPQLKQWQQRPLESHYPFVWLDAHPLQDQRGWALRQQSGLYRPRPEPDWQKRDSGPVSVRKRGGQFLVISADRSQ